MSKLSLHVGMVHSRMDAYLAFKHQAILPLIWFVVFGEECHGLSQVVKQHWDIFAIHAFHHNTIFRQLDFV